MCSYFVCCVSCYGSDGNIWIFLFLDSLLPVLNALAVEHNVFVLRGFKMRAYSMRMCLCVLCVCGCYVCLWMFWVKFVIIPFETFVGRFVFTTFGATSMKQQFLKEAEKCVHKCLFGLFGKIENGKPRNKKHKASEQITFPLASFLRLKMQSSKRSKAFVIFVFASDYLIGANISSK